MPSAVLLSKFTSARNALLIAVNVGGLGTPVASLASLITFSEYGATNTGSTKKYLGIFLAVNFSFLAALTLVSWLILPVL